MRMSRRAKRMDAHHKRKKRLIGFNLVSLMDIFTILVFFLLVNSSEVEVLPSTQGVTLPESRSDVKAKESIVVLVSDNDILVQGHKVASINDVLSPSMGKSIPALADALASLRKRALTKVKQGEKFNGEVTIMGDKDTSYELLKKIMLTCASVQYGRISLAVTQRSRES